VVVNFGGNVRFAPRHLHRPRDERELLAVLEAHRGGQIRVVAAGHSWSGAIVSGDALVDMRHFDAVRVHREAGGTFVTVGAGCRIKHLLAALERQGLTIPSVGLITEQTIAGAIATGTHGSGRHSLSPYVSGLRIACYEGGTARIRSVSKGAELRAARCGLGCLGVVVEVTLPCVPRYFVKERITVRDSIPEILALREAGPLQQFYLIPHMWRYFVQERSVAEATERSPSAPLYRLYWLLNLDVGLHLLIKLFASLLRSRRRVRFLYRHILPRLAVRNWEVVDRSDRMLVMEHELFRHLEMELFVPERRLEEAAEYLTGVLRVADGASGPLPVRLREAVERVGMREELDRLRGSFTHHYPVCFRRVLADDTLVSMSAGDEGAWYAISLITYVEPREPFYELARFLASSMAGLFGARLHWGKWFPLDHEAVRKAYPALPEFQAICDRFDPAGVFRNAFTARALGLPPGGR
jgi:FAD/FMN-containing dehydrogenase